MGLMEKKWQFYLAGKMSGLTFKEMNEWRTDAKKKISRAANSAGYDTIVVNPVDFYNFETIEYQTQGEVMDYDLFNVEHSEILIVNVDGLNSSPGTIMEIFDAWNFKKPIIAFGNYDNPHPWIKRCFTRLEPDIQSVIEYLKNYYFV